MTPLEATTLCRLAKAACPQQAFDEYTPDAWHEILSDLRFEDAKDALFAVTREQPFVAPAEIRAAVKRIRADRIRTFGPFDPPPEIENYNRWLGEMRRRIADGEITRETYRPVELVAGEMPALEEVFPHVEAE